MVLVGREALAGRRERERRGRAVRVGRKASAKRRKRGGESDTWEGERGGEGGQLRKALRFLGVGATYRRKDD